MRTLITIVATFVCCAAGFAATLKVPSQFSTIQAAINAAANGDTVLVAPGTYVENIDFLGKGITVISEKGPDVTVIDGGNPSNPDFGSVVIFQTGEDDSAILEGFTITHGTGTWYQGTSWSGYLGGGIQCMNSASPVIRGNVVTKNKAVDPTDNSGGGGINIMHSSTALVENNWVTENQSNWGGGIEVLSSTPKIINNAVSANTINVSGGGFLTGNSDAEILNNTITDNSAAYGGGIQIEGGSPVFKGNVVSGNKVTYVCGGVRIFGGTGLVDQNVITNNSAGTWGGGVQSVLQDNSTFTNNVVSGNTSQYGGGFCIYEAEPWAENNLFYGNSATYGGGIDLYQYSTAFLVNNTLFENTAT